MWSLVDSSFLMWWAHSSFPPSAIYKMKSELGRGIFRLAHIGIYQCMHTWHLYIYLHRYVNMNIYRLMNMYMQR